MPKTLYALALAQLAFVAVPAFGEQKLHHKLDQLIRAGSDLPRAVQSSDEEFHRRVHLDLIGRPPTSAQVRAFSSDASGRKRQALIDDLLSRPGYSEHLAEWFDALLMERRPKKHVEPALWRAYLRKSFEDNKPWNRLAKEVLLADGTDAAIPAAARFYLGRGGESKLIARDVGRLFLGRDLRCARCHDDLLRADYRMKDFYGLVAFLNRSFVFKDKRQRSLFAERAEGEVSYASAFSPQEQETVRPRLPGGKAIDEPTTKDSEKYLVAPAEGVRPVPRFSRRKALAERVSAADNSALARNMVNRLWAKMLGRGLVHPVDMHHSENPPSHPAAYELLTKEFAGSGFDIKDLVRTIALTETYQQSSRLPTGDSGVPEPTAFAVAKIRPLSPEQLGHATMVATGLVAAERESLGPKPMDAKLSKTLRPHLNAFVSHFSALPGVAHDHYEASIDQALFVSNAPMIKSWLEPRPGNLMHRLQRLGSVDEAISEIYLSVLSRRPRSAERSEAVESIDGAPDRQAGCRELAWALLSSVEFRFNH